MRRVRVVVSGRVQGVFFRDTVRREAEAEAVSGWVRNRDDGAVEAVFEGADDQVARMVDLCRHGPRGSRVEGVEMDEEEPRGTSGFEVR